MPLNVCRHANTCKQLSSAHMVLLYYKLSNYKTNRFWWKAGHFNQNGIERNSSIFIQHKQYTFIFIVFLSICVYVTFSQFSQTTHRNSNKNIFYFSFYIAAYIAFEEQNKNLLFRIVLPIARMAYHKLTISHVL